MLVKRKMNKRPWNYRDLTGQRFGRLTVLGLSHRKGTNNYWHVLCSCGVTRCMRGSHIANRSQSCGCLARQNRLAALSKHGHATGGKVSVEYAAYHAARSRCQPGNQNYENYGARGIKFLFASFEQFLAEVGPRPSARHSLDRIDNDGNYEPGNVRWATCQQQAMNRRTPRRKHARTT